MRFCFYFYFIFSFNFCFATTKYVFSVPQFLNFIISLLDNFLVKTETILNFFFGSLKLDLFWLCHNLRLKFYKYFRKLLWNILNKRICQKFPSTIFYFTQFSLSIQTLYTEQKHNNLCPIVPPPFFDFITPSMLFRMSSLNAMMLFLLYGKHIYWYNLPST